MRSTNPATQVGQLKQRISGKIKVPIEYLLLFFLGELLRDDDYLPSRSFELTQDVDSDDDIFRPRSKYLFSFVLRRPL